MSDELPDKSSIIYLVRNQLLQFKLDSIKRVKLLFKRYIDEYPTWGQEFDLELSLASFSDNKQNRFDPKSNINNSKNQALNNLRISQITLGIVVIILFIALVVFIRKTLIKQPSQTLNSSKIYSQALPTEENLT